LIDDTAPKRYTTNSNGNQKAAQETAATIRQYVFEKECMDE